MSRITESRDYPSSVNRKDIEARLNTYVQEACEQEGSGGLPRPIRWMDNVDIQDDWDAAKRKINDLKRYDYDAIAVRYYATDYRAQPPASFLKLVERKNAAGKKWNDANRKFHFANAKSKFVSCPVCGSKLSVEYLGRGPEHYTKNLCPLCKADLRPKSTQERIASLEKTYRDLAEKVDKEADAIHSKRTGEVRWRLIFQYHV